MVFKLNFEQIIIFLSTIPSFHSNHEMGAWRQTRLCDKALKFVIKKLKLMLQEMV
jgi:hypothetical protein